MSAHRADGTGGGIGLLNLPKNLRFAYDHRIQARGHAEDVPDNIFLAVLVEMGIQFVRLYLKVFTQKTAQVGSTICGVSHELHAVAGGDHHALFDSGMRREVAARIGQKRFRNSQAFAHLDRCAVVIHADKLESHEAANLCITLK